MGVFNIKSIFMSLFVGCLFLLLGSNIVEASDATNEIIDKEKLESTIEMVNEEFEDVKLDYKGNNSYEFNNQVNSMTDKELYDYLYDLALKIDDAEMQIYDQDIRIDEVKNENTPMVTKTVTNKVSAVIPAVGTGSINIQYTVNVSAGHFNSINVIDSWLTGINWATWIHKDGSVVWVDGNSPRYAAKVRAHGVMSWDIPGTDLGASSNEIFQYTDYAANY